MVTVTEKVIQISPFQVLPKSQTRRTTENVDYFLDMGDGIDVSIDLNLQDLNEGMIFIDQVCNSHRLFFKKDTEEKYTFQLPETHYDSHKESDSHYRSFKVTNNKISGGLNNVHFYDAPFVALEKHWKEFNYSIDFEVWVQHQDKDAKVTPICKFNWRMLAQCVNTNGTWDLIHGEYSNEEEIHQTFKILGPEDNPIDVTTMSHLASAVTKFKGKNGL